MIAIVLIALFAAATLLAVGTLTLAYRTYRHRFAELRRDLRETERGVEVRCTWREPSRPRPSAAIYNLRFTPRADCLPFHPERELRVAA